MTITFSSMRMTSRPLEALRSGSASLATTTIPTTTGRAATRSLVESAMQSTQWLPTIDSTVTAAAMLSLSTSPNSTPTRLKPLSGWQGRVFDEAVGKQLDHRATQLVQSLVKDPSYDPLAWGPEIRAFVDERVEGEDPRLFERLERALSAYAYESGARTKAERELAKRAEAILLALSQSERDRLGSRRRRRPSCRCSRRTSKASPAAEPSGLLRRWLAWSRNDSGCLARSVMPQLPVIFRPVG